MTSSSAISSAIQEGVFAINKPAGITSAQVVRDVVYHFTNSSYFRPWLEEEQDRRKKEGFRQRNRRNKYHKKVQVKVGHGGTLDPDATGCLVIGVGKGTKQLQSFIESRKTYDSVILFGAATDSYDASGKVLAKAPYDHISAETVRGALDQFRGDIKQQPPIFSALKMDGMKLYEYARSGKELPREIAFRPAKVYELEMTDWLAPGTHDYTLPSETATEEDRAAGFKLLKLGETVDSSKTARPDTGDKRKRSVSPGLAEPKKEPKIEGAASEKAVPVPAPAPSTSVNPEKPPAARLIMDVGSGFYVRSLCHDLGKAVGSLGLMASLVRTKQGPFSLDKNCLAYEDLKAGEETWRPKVQQAFQAWEDHLASNEAKSADKDAQADRNTSSEPDDIPKKATG